VHGCHGTAVEIPVNFINITVCLSKEYGVSKNLLVRRQVDGDSWNGLFDTQAGPMAVLFNDTWRSIGSWPLFVRQYVCPCRSWYHVMMSPESILSFDRSASPCRARTYDMY